ncbi:MAG: flavodoxin [Acidimicrobiaceae bacterium]|nr:flavodoxin [Acidimicrobiaceae bacterium]
MRAWIVYESMFGNTRTIAERIGDGMVPDAEVTVLRVGEVIGRSLDDVDLVVVGGPTHAHGMSRHASRASAAEQAGKDRDLTLDVDADGPGLREWFDALGQVDGIRAAAFDTRVDAPEILTGHASHGIAKRLRRHEFELVAEPESFLVDKHNALVHGEDDRAAEWGEAVVAATLVA